MNRLALFDVDGTLVKDFGVHKLPFLKAFKEIYGIDVSGDSFGECDGFTNQQIILKVLKKEGLDESEIKAKIEDCMKAVAGSFLKQIENEKIRVLKGVPEMIKEMDKRKILLGLVTGNLESIARAKLNKVGLNKYFKVGGFGNDDIDRTKLVGLAVKRAEERFGFEFNDNVFLFGDTPLDIKAGQEARVKTVGVATGKYTKEQLKDAGADFVLKDLRDAGKVLKIIL